MRVVARRKEKRANWEPSEKEPEGTKPGDEVGESEDRQGVGGGRGGGEKERDRTGNPRAIDCPSQSSSVCRSVVYVYV